MANNYNNYKNYVGKKIQIKSDGLVLNISEMKLENNSLIDSKILGIVLLNKKWYFILQIRGNEIIEKVPCKDFIGQIDSIYFLTKKEKNMDNISEQEIETDEEFINDFLGLD